MLKVCIDGGAINNPGPAGIAVVIHDDKGQVIKEVKKSVGSKTNNEAEYLALIEALRTLKQYKEEKIVIHTDSMLLWGQMNNQYQIKEESLFPYYIKAHNYWIGFKDIQIVQVPREKNTHADALVKSVTSNRSLEI